MVRKYIFFNIVVFSFFFFTNYFIFQLPFCLWLSTIPFFCFCSNRFSTTNRKNDTKLIEKLCIFQDYGRNILCYFHGNRLSFEKSTKINIFLFVRVWNGIFLYWHDENTCGVRAFIPKRALQFLKIYTVLYHASIVRFFLSTAFSRKTPT